MLTSQLKASAGHYDLLRLLATVYLSQHRSREALETGQLARNMRPDDAWTYGVIGDASIELGEYDPAFAAFDTMMKLTHPQASTQHTLSTTDRRLGKGASRFSYPPVRKELRSPIRDIRGSLRARSFSHAGITVSDFNKAVRFYWDVFGCPLVGVADTPPERVRSFFGVAHDSPTCKIGWIRVPGGGVLEIFEFQPQQPPGPVPWNGVGLTHISFNVRNLQKWHDYLAAKGVPIVSKPERSPRGHSFFFVRDFDGNLIELMDLGYMYHVLKWLGPLGGWIFRRGMYKKYYESAT